MLRLLRGASGTISSLLNPGKFSTNVRFLSTNVQAEQAEAVPDSASEAPAEDVPLKEQRVTAAYNAETFQKLKLDQYPLYVEREWWKRGKRMTFWATWRQLRDVNRRKQVQQVAPEKMRLKAIKFNTILPQAIRDEASEKMTKASRYDHPRLILNMCMFTGRQRGKIKPYRLNRHLFRKAADHSQLSGVQRAMW